MKYICEPCNKEYKSEKTLLNHTRLYHLDNNKICNKCDYCDKKFTFMSNKYRHLKICKQKKIKEMENNNIILENNHNLEIEKIKLEQIKEEKQILELKIKLDGKKINNITFKKLNKMLMDNVYKINNSIINSNNTNSNNTIINNYNLISFDKEEIQDVLSKTDKKMIMNSGLYCLERMTEIVNIGNYNQFKNIIITNLKDNYIYKYDDKLGYFIIANKENTLKEVINSRITDIEAIYDELDLAKNIDPKIKNKIQDFLEKINQDEVEFIDHDENITYPSYKDYKLNKIKILLYNNQDKITKDIALYILNDR